MRRVLKWLLAAVVALGIGLVVAVQVGRMLSDRRIDAEVNDLLAANAGAPPGAITEADLAPLPEPVQRWLRWAGVVGRERVSTVRMEQRGEFRLGEDRDWIPFTATQHYTTNPPGFLWSVELELMPLVTVSGRDGYRNGEGSIEMRVLSLVPVASKTGGGLNQGAALRYLNEIMWFPTAALSEQITWEPVDATSARAVFRDGDLTVSTIFVFDAEGKITTMTADRYNDEKDDILPWSTPIEAWGEFDGLRIPVKGQGVWAYPTGDFTYIRLEITDIAYDPV
jgi:hypothetical protein